MFELPVWLIAVIAVAAALILVGAPLTIHGLITRRRHRQYMQKSEQDLRVYLRPRLSARASNYLDIVRPPLYVRRESEIQQSNTTWTPLQTAELIAPEAAPPERKDGSLSLPKAKRMRGLRDSIYGHSGAHAPKNRRQKKINKTISLKDMNRSPLSAITEMTDSTVNELPMPVELPAERTPHVTPEPRSAVSPVQSNTVWSIPAQKQRPEHLSPLELDTPVSLKRPSFEQTAELPISPSKSIVSGAPDSPLPPLPKHQLYHKPSGAKRASQISTATVGSSVLGGFSSSELNLPQTVNSGMQQFDFGFNAAPPARVGPSPGRQTDWHGGRDVTSVIPSFDFHGQRASTTSITESEAEKIEPRREKTVEWTPGPDFFFGKQQPKSNRNSEEDPTARDEDLPDENRQMTGKVSSALLPPRPASVASSQPFRLDQTPTFCRSRLSVSSTGSGRRNHGHRRQNCVRICIPAIPVSPVARPGASALIRRPSHISEAAEDSDEDASSPERQKSANSTPNRSPTTRKQLSARRSIVDANGSPSAPAPVSRVVRRSVADVRTDVPSAASSDSGESRPDSDVFWSHPDDMMVGARKNDPFAYPNRWALLPTRPGSMGLEPGTKLSVFEHPNSEDDSPILPSPCKPAAANTSATRHSEAIRPPGARQAPAFPSTNINIQRSSSKHSTTRSGPGSPTRRISFRDIEEAPTQDFRRSVAQLRSLDSSGRQLNAESKLWVAGDTPSTNQNHEDWKRLNALWEVSRSNSVNSLSTRATPGIPKRNVSTAASSSMERKNSGPRANPSNGMFGSSKRKMSQPHSKQEFNSSNSGIQRPVPLVPNNSTRFRKGSASGSPSRSSLNSFSNVSVWEDESICGDSPEHNSTSPSRRASLSARVQQPAGHPPPRLESLPDGPFPPQHYPWKQYRNRPQGLGITIPPSTYHPHNRNPVLDPSPSQKQLKAQYFGSVDWDKDGTAAASNPANAITDSHHSHEKENILTLSPSSATPTSSTSASMSLPLPSSTVKHPSILDRGRDHELDLDVYSTPPTSTEINVNSFSYSHQRYNFNFPLPGSGGRRPGTAGTITSTGTGDCIGRTPSPTDTAHSSGGNSGVAAAPHFPSVQKPRKISPAQQRLKDELRERAAGVSSMGTGMRSPPPQVLTEKHRARMDGLGGTGGLGSAFATPQGNTASDSGPGGSSGRAERRDYDRELENAISSPRRPHHQQPHPPRDQSLRSGSSSVASARSRNDTPVDYTRRLDGSKTPTPTPGTAGVGAPGSAAGSAGAMGSAKTLKNLYDSDGFLKDSPLAKRSARVAALAAAAKTGVPEVDTGGNGNGNGSGSEGSNQVLTGAAGGLVGRSYRRMQ